MDIATARKIAHNAYQRGGDRVNPLVDELSWVDHLGDTATAGQVVRTLDDLAGFYEDGKFIGGRTIAKAVETCRGFGSR